jgi:hypothetical protein
MMNTKPKSAEKFRITGDWTKQSKLLKAKYSQLTDKDLVLDDGRDEELLNRLQRRLSRNRDGIIEILKAMDPPATSA